MTHLDLAPIGRAAGSVRLPGSKSISNRVLLLAALAKGSTKVHGLLDAEDTRVMLGALQKLDIVIDMRDFAGMVVNGAGGISCKKMDLFLGNAGTAFRPLTAALALSGDPKGASQAYARARELARARAAAGKPPLVALPMAGRLLVIQGPGGAFSHESLRNAEASDLVNVDATGRAFRASRTCSSW